MILPNFLGAAAGEAQYYGDILHGHRYGDAYDAEAEWDRRAKAYDASQKIKSRALTEQVTALLLEKGALSGSVLDVGGGTGQYAVPFARHAEEVIVTDLSSKMMEFAVQNAKNAGLDNVGIWKLDWETFDPAQLGWERKFDLVFSSMSPAIRSLEGFSNLVAVSRGWCCINQFIRRNDTISDRLADTLKNKRPEEFHNERNLALAFFHLAWMCGFEPEVTYFRETETLSLTLDQAMVRYAGRFGARAEERGLDLREMLAACSENGELNVEGRSTLAVIYWKV